MARSMGFRLLMATLVAGLAATPALAGKKKNKKKKVRSEAAAAAEPGAGVAGPAPPAGRVIGKKGAKGPGAATNRGKQGKGKKVRKGRAQGKLARHKPRRAGSGTDSGAQGTAPGSGPFAQSRPGAAGTPRSQGAKPHSGPFAQSRPRAASKPRSQGAKPRGGPFAQPSPRGADKPRRQGTRPGAGGGPLIDRAGPKKPKRTVRIEQSVLRPEGWTPQAHRYHLKDVPTFSAENLGAGVFMYNPPPKRHQVKVVEKNPVTGSMQSVRMPSRAVDRRGSFALGLKGGTLVEQEVDASQLSGDMGYGIVARFRPIEAFGIEGSWMRHEDASSGALVRDPLSVSAQLFAFPWTRLSPYVTGGVTFDGPASRASAPEAGRRMTPHAGLGLELALGRSIAVDIEGRYLSQMQALSDDPLSEGGAVQATAGLLVHF